MAKPAVNKFRINLEDLMFVHQLGIVATSAEFYIYRGIVPEKTFRYISTLRFKTKIIRIMKEHFLLNPNITFLNFGSFGACPKEIFASYQQWQLELEREPIQFMMHKGPDQIRKSREALAAYIHCNPDDLVFTTNPSYAINIVAKNFRLNKGDEILTTDLEYGAMDRTWNYYARQNGYTFRRQPIRLPLVSKEDFLDQFWAGLRPNTRAIFISQITSSTGLIFPVKEICTRAKELGLLTIVDGAHVPGHVDLDLTQLEADIYTGACHKWMMAPKGCSFLYAKPDVQKWLDPLVISWGYESLNPSSSQFQDYHQQQGTRDFSAFLTIPDCLEFMKKHNWSEVSKRCRRLVIDDAPRFADLLQTTLLAPLTEEFFGQMCSLEIQTSNPEALKKALYHDHQIEIPIMPHDGKVYIRYSINAFNSQEDLDKLADALVKLRTAGMIS